LDECYVNVLVLLRNTEIGDPFTGELDRDPFGDAPPGNAIVATGTARGFGFGSKLTVLLLDLGLDGIISSRIISTSGLTGTNPSLRYSSSSRVGSCMMIGVLRALTSALGGVANWTKLKNVNTPKIIMKIP
jgi:hypothetical protein